MMNVQDKNSGRMSSIFLQYRTNKQCDAHRPCTIMISGGVPLRSKSVAPPIQKPCCKSSSYPAAFLISLHLPINQSFVSGAHPSLVSNVKKGTSVGTFPLT